LDGRWAEFKHRVFGNDNAMTFSFVVALGTWLLGRACLYVLAGANASQIQTETLPNPTLAAIPLKSYCRGRGLLITRRDIAHDPLPEVPPQVAKPSLLQTPDE
jgi:hypothetical protein